MSRRRRAEKRDILPDPKFGDVVVTKFMNYVMYEGKKAVAENIMYALSTAWSPAAGYGPEETFNTPSTTWPGQRSAPARRRRDLPGPGKSHRAPQGVAIRAGERGGKRGGNNMTEKWPASCWSSSKPRAGIKKRKTRKRWPKPTGPSHLRW